MTSKLDQLLGTKSKKRLSEMVVHSPPTSRREIPTTTTPITSSVASVIDDVPFRFKWFTVVSRSFPAPCGMPGQIAGPHIHPPSTLNRQTLS